MKKKSFLPKQVVLFLSQLSVVCMLFNACNGDETLATITQKNEVAVKLSQNSDSAEIIPAVVDSTLLARLQMQTRTLRSNPSIPAEELELFKSNIYQLRGLPITIRVRGTGDKTNCCFTCYGAGREVGLSPFNSSVYQQFYLRILPSSSGIPYMIYSYAANRPISVGYYKNDPNRKVLYARYDDKGSAFMASWDLIPSTYRGYFAIESTDYLGTADPNNPWSVFRYYLEAVNANSLGFAKYANKPEQEFLIQPAYDFTIDHIAFDKSSAKVTKRTPLEVVSYGKNETEEQRPFTITTAHYATNTSMFVDKSILKIPFNNEKVFYSPKVEAGRLVVPSPIDPDELEQPDFERGLKYTNTMHSTRVMLKFDVNGNAKPNSLIEVTSWLENYNVSVNYTVYMTYTHNGTDKRTVKLNGVWYGTLYTTKRAKPDIVKFFDLDDGEELLRIKNKGFKFNKTILR